MGTLVRLLTILNNAKDSSTHYHIAEILLKNFARLENMTIVEIAELCFVSKSTISKFIRYMGYEDFAEFKTSAAYRSDCQSNRLNYNDNILGYMKSHTKEEYIDLIIRDLELAKSGIDMKKIDEVADDLMRYEKIAAFGIMYSESAALDFQMKLAYSGKYIISYLDEEEQYSFIKKAEEDTLIIIFSNSGDYIKKYQFVKPYIHKNIFRQTKAKVVIITGNKEMEKYPDIDLCICLEHSSEVQTHQVLFSVATDLIASKYREKIEELKMI